MNQKIMGRGTKHTKGGKKRGGEKEEVARIWVKKSPGMNLMYSRKRRGGTGRDEGRVVQGNKEYSNALSKKNMKKAPQKSLSWDPLLGEERKKTKRGDSGRDKKERGQTVQFQWKFKQNADADSRVGEGESFFTRVLGHYKV